jgi:hypothetical protein
MQDTQAVQEAQSNPVETTMSAYLSKAVMQTEFLLTILHTLQRGTDLPLTTWQEAFEAFHGIVEQISAALDQAQESFDEHMMQVPDSLSKELTCGEFACLAWE